MVVDDGKVLPEEFVVLSLDDAVPDDEDDDTGVDGNEDDAKDDGAEDGDADNADVDDCDCEKCSPSLTDGNSIFEGFSSSFTCDTSNFSRFFRIEGGHLEIFSKSSAYSQLMFVFVLIRYNLRDFNFLFVLLLA